MAYHEESDPIVQLLQAVADLNKQVLRLASQMDRSEALTYSVEQAAEVLGVSRSKMYDILHRPDFPVVDVGNRRLIPRRQLERWLENQCERRASQ
ncbi:helix-turn-helix domain-containing protein [Thermoactinomyces sp. CICC 23799]|uniref:helix-turn-helix domain-containing protein n=1 Tax=Thermoactinomyces sp. CICC 23799 TaxID=2767429 RepID=UPI0018DDDA04|nr:helix-turn-helix domain-containing protein [Thermoactinomyces sp. CICC 23799]MBH8600497.1 helix-turn-helix domain-containing protein [Thermoactinomyces sp. CICC 23799]